MSVVSYKCPHCGGGLNYSPGVGFKCEYCLSVMTKEQLSALTDGDIGEDAAVRLLTANGCRVLCRNYKAAHSEIDVIAEKGAQLLFVEVKLRRIGTERGAAAVDDGKRKRLLSAAEAFLAENRADAYISSLSPRFDVVEVFADENRAVSANLIENAFSGA